MTCPECGYTRETAECDFDACQLRQRRPWPAPSLLPPTPAQERAERLASTRAATPWDMPWVTPPPRSVS